MYTHQPRDSGVLFTDAPKTSSAKPTGEAPSSLTQGMRRSLRNVTRKLRDMDPQWRQYSMLCGASLVFLGIFIAQEHVTDLKRRRLSGGDYWKRYGNPDLMETEIGTDFDPDLEIAREHQRKLHLATGSRYEQKKKKHKWVGWGSGRQPDSVSAESPTFEAGTRETTVNAVAATALGDMMSLEPSGKKPDTPDFRPMSEKQTKNIANVAALIYFAASTSAIAINIFSPENSPLALTICFGVAVTVLLLFWATQLSFGWHLGHAKVWLRASAALAALSAGAIATMIATPIPATEAAHPLQYTIAEIAAPVLLVVFVLCMLKAVWQFGPKAWDMTDIFATVTAVAASGAIVCGFLPHIEAFNVSNAIGGLNITTVACTWGFLALLLVTFLSSNLFDLKLSMANVGAFIGFSGAAVVGAAFTMQTFPTDLTATVDIHLMLIIGTIISFSGLALFAIKQVRFCVRPAKDNRDLGGMGGGAMRRVPHDGH